MSFETLKRGWGKFLVFLLILAVVFYALSSYPGEDKGAVETIKKTSDRIVNYFQKISLLSPTCGNGVCEGGESFYTCESDCSWPKFEEKIKAIHDSNDGGTKYANESKLDFYLSIGLNTIISHSNGELRLAYYNFTKYSDTYMPPVLTNYSKFSYEKGFRYFPGIAWTYNVSRPSYYIQSGKFEKAVLIDGSEIDEVSPWSEDYWNNYTELLVRLAKYGKSPGNNINGVWFDFELYTVGGLFINDSWGFENSTWRGFLQTINNEDQSVINKPYNQRAAWLTEQKHLDEYYAYLHNLMYIRARNMKIKVDEVNPNFLIGAYPSPVTNANRKYLDDIYSGWSYPDSPVVVWGTDSYAGGGVDNVPKSINESNLLDGKYFNLTTAFNKSMHGYYFGGLLISSYWYSSGKFYDRVLPMANATSGYWIWKSEVITAKCEDLVSPNTYEGRLPVNCASDSRNPGCCLNNRQLSDAQWINECCPNYDQTVNELWQAINKTNIALTVEQTQPLPPNPPANDDDSNSGGGGGGGSNNVKPQCNDGRDNDGDGFIDYPGDFGCESLTDNDELNPEQLAGPSGCTPLWNCGEWTSCENNVHTRECVDIRYCGLNAGKPAIEENCVAGSEEILTRIRYDVIFAGALVVIGLAGVLGGVSWMIFFRRPQVESV